MSFLIIRVKLSLNDKIMHIAIPSVTVPRQKKARVALLQLSGFNIFSFRFCPICCGYQKVNRVQSIEHRQKVFVRRNQSDAIPTALDYLVNSCVKQNDQKLADSTWTLSELMTEELRLQLLIPGDQGRFAFKQARDNQSANCVQEKNQDRVPDHLVIQTVGLTVISNPLKELCDGELQGTHLRSYRAKQGGITLDPYWQTRLCKPGALSGSAAIEAAGDNLTFEKYRHGLLQQECKVRAENRKKSMIHQTNFPQPQGLRYLSREHLPLETQESLPLGEHREFISRGRHLILTGNTRTGKTRPVLGQGIKVGSEGFLVVFIMFLRMLTRISEKRSEQSISNREQCVENNDPTIYDEFGDIACDKEGSELLYDHRSLMAAHKSMIMTNTLSSDRWYEIFRDPILPAAIIESLIHLAFIINMNGQWSCIKETCK